jgi:hypothetical protein
MPEQIPSNETRIEDPAIAPEVASRFWNKAGRDSAALSRRAIELINDTEGSDIDKLNTFGKLKKDNSVANTAYQMMHPNDFFPGVPPLEIRTSERAIEEGTETSKYWDESASRGEDRTLADIKAREL